MMNAEERQNSSRIKYFRSREFKTLLTVYILSLALAVTTVWLMVYGRLNNYDDLEAIVVLMIGAGPFAAFSITLLPILLLRTYLAIRVDLGTMPSDKAESLKKYAYLIPLLALLTGPLEILFAILYLILLFWVLFNLLTIKYA